MDPLGIRILIVDDHPIVVGGLVSSLVGAPGLYLAGHAASLSDARERLASVAVDIVLLDARLPDGLGFDLIGELDARGHSPGCILLSTYETPQYIALAVRLGAAGYLLKTSPITDIVSAIRTVAAGGTSFAARFLASAREARTTSLSDRERDVVRGVAAGRSNEEIAATLGISKKTVEAYLTRLFERFDVVSRTELALRAERDGLLEGPRAPRRERNR
jgi:DNA-binding NarL/FixJ family response regulator